MSVIEENLQQIKTKNYSLRISENIFNRINNHVHILKRLESRSHSKQRWIEEAICEKLNHEEALNNIKLPKEKHLSFKISESLSKRIENRIELVRKFKISYSAKKWLLDAITEKLERENEKATALLLKLKDINSNSRSNH